MKLKYSKMSFKHFQPFVIFWELELQELWRTRIDLSLVTSKTGGSSQLGKLGVRSRVNQLVKLCGTLAAFWKYLKYMRNIWMFRSVKSWLTSCVFQFYNT